MVKAGYNHTEVGRIPGDWKIAELTDIAVVIDGDRGFNYPSENDFLDDGYCLFLSARNVTKEGFRFSECYFITKEKDRLLRKGKLNRNDIVLTTRGTVGNLAFFNDSVPFDAIRINSGMVVIRNASETVDQKYLYRVLRSFLTKRQIDKVVFGSAQPQLTVKVINQFLIPLPPMEEQQAIAEALSDVDALIAALDKLIAKKRDIKTAAMQQLLTGKKRLPGFGEGKGYKQTEIGVIPEDWHCLRIPEVTIRNPKSIKIGPFGSQLKKELLSKTGFKVYGQENVFEKDMTISDRFLSEEHFRNLKSCEIRPGDFLISMMGTIGKCMIVPEGIQEGIMDSHLLRLKLDNSKVYPYLLLQLFETKIVFDQVKQLSVGGIMEGLSSKIIRNIYLPLPKIIEEQQAIAEMLSDIDSEIAAIESRRAKTQAIKQGMMQELLTGRTRLHYD